MFEYAGWVLHSYIYIKSTREQHTVLVHVSGVVPADTGAESIRLDSIWNSSPECNQQVFSPIGKAKRGWRQTYLYTTQPLRTRLSKFSRLTFRPVPRHLFSYVMEEWRLCVFNSMQRSQVLIGGGQFVGLTGGHSHLLSLALSLSANTHTCSSRVLHALTPLLTHSVLPAARQPQWSPHPSLGRAIPYRFFGGSLNAFINAWVWERSRLLFAVCRHFFLFL